MGKRYLGVDLQRNVFTVCIRYESGKSRIEEWQVSALGNFEKRLKSTDEIAVESTGNARFFCDAVKQKVSRVVIVNPAQFKVISRSVKKTDKNDAETLALFLSKGLLPEIRMKDKLHSQISSLSQTRDKLVKLRTTLKNKINNIASSYGIQLRKEAMSSEKGLREVLTLEVDELSKVEIEVMVEQIRSLNRGNEKLEKEIREEGKKMPGHKNLTSIKGIGEKGASILLSVIGDIKDFPDEGKLASYFGIVPRVNNSNETERSGRITKRGSKLGCTTLVQCTLIATRYSPYLQHYYALIKKMRGTGKAIIATARKFLGIIYLTLKNKWVFEDFPNFVLVK
ncbi:MAG: IS110 family transposase [Candidatus Scalindua sp.]|nr:IS110 family transposase [Candidatus Scalindua sp.]